MSRPQMVRAAKARSISWLHAAGYHAFKGKDLPLAIAFLPIGPHGLDSPGHDRNLRPMQALCKPGGPRSSGDSSCRADFSGPSDFRTITSGKSKLVLS